MCKIQSDIFHNPENTWGPCKISDLVLVVRKSRNKYKLFMKISADRLLLSVAATLKHFEWQFGKKI